MLARLLAISLLMYVLQSCSSSKDRSCSDVSCAAPFRYCDRLTGACEVLKRVSITEDDWLNACPYLWSRESPTKVACGADGNYPSVDNQVFYHCKDGSASMVYCSSTEFPFFDPISEQCVSTNKNPFFDCINGRTKKVELTGSRSSFFAYCFKPDFFSKSATQAYLPYFPKLIARCYGRDIFNGTTQRCEPRCLQKGLLPDTSDCHSYFLCSLQDPVTVVFNMTKVTCPDGQGFHQEELRCVSEEEVPSCVKPYPYPV